MHKMIVLLVLLLSFSLIAQTAEKPVLTPEQKAYIEKNMPGGLEDFEKIPPERQVLTLKFIDSVIKKQSVKYSEEEIRRANEAYAASRAGRPKEPVIPDNDRDIVFYGKVVDYDGQPVPDATIKVNVTKYDPDALFFSTGIDVYTVTADDKGVFFVKDHGSRMVISSIECDGYVTGGNFNISRIDFIKQQYIENGEAVTFVPTPSDPIVFKIRKYGVRDYLQVNDLGGYLRKSDGRPLYPLLLDTWMDEYGTKRDVKEGSPSRPVFDPDRCLEISYNFSEDGKEFELVFKAVHENSGLLMVDKFLYEAPEDGYQKEVVYRNTMVKPDDKALYVRGWYCEPFYIFVQGPNKKFYSRLEVEVITNPVNQKNTDPHLRLTGHIYTNPLGRRYFEYDRKFIQREREFRKLLNLTRQFEEEQARKNEEVFNVIEFKKMVDQQYAGRNLEKLKADYNTRFNEGIKEMEARQEARLRAAGLWSDDPAERMRLQKEHIEQQRAERQQMQQEALRRIEEQRQRVEANLKARAKIAAEKAAAEKAAQEQAK